MNGVRRSAVVLLAVVAERLISKSFRSWTEDEELVLEAFRRSADNLRDADPADIGEYLDQFDSQQIRGVLRNVKGIFHEMLYARAENNDGDDIFSKQKENLNDPGTDIELLMDGEVIKELQLKATNSPDYIREHMARYPDIDVLATEEVARQVEGVKSSGFSNDELSEITASVTRELDSADTIEEITDGMGAGLSTSAIIQAGKAIKSKDISNVELRKALGDTAVGGAAATILDLIIGPMV